MSIDFDDPVVGAQADGLGRSSGNGVHHDQGIAQQVELDPDAAKLPVEALAHLRHLLRIDIGRMGVQLGQHAADGALDQRGHLHLIDVQGIERLVNLVEFHHLARVVAARDDGRERQRPQGHPCKKKN